jgi:hypothetical protein
MTPPPVLRGGTRRTCLVVPVCTLQRQELAALCSAGLEASCARRTTGIAGGNGDYRRNLGC